MGIYIKGMTMPSCCDVCRFSDWSNLHQTACCKMRDYDPCFEDHSMDYMEKRADFCPLVEIPEPRRDKSITDDLAFRCKQCEFAMPDGRCLAKVMARKLCPDYKDFGAMGDL